MRSHTVATQQPPSPDQTAAAAEDRTQPVPGRTGRVAVVLVHGIGQQRPMATLRRFVKEYYAKQRKESTVWSVPDRCDQSFELHTYVVPAEADPGGLPQVDFYEGYWAPLVRGTRLTHLLGWARRLIWRRPGDLPRRLQWLWWVTAAAALVAVGLLAWFFLALGEDSAWTQTAKLLGAIAGSAIAATLASTLGDAARYLDDQPDNVAARFAVRNQLVTLLEALHRGGRYRKIVVVGHSLGGVIAYDALRLLWARRTVDWDASGIDDSAAAHAAEALGVAATRSADRAPAAQRAAGGLTAPGGGDSGADARTAFDLAQAELFSRLSHPSGGEPPRWLVSDLVTIGAPLAYPALLLTPPGTNLSDLIEEREVPTCPPQLAGRTDPRSFRYPSRPVPQSVGQPDIRVFHHAALFAVTRWTNIYAAGDFVGGPIDPLLGTAIHNHHLGGKESRWMTVPFLSHSRYWTEPAGQELIGRILNEAARR